MFNALKYTQEMEKAGFTREQAEVSVRVLIDVMNENFATKSDVKELDLKIDSSVLRLETKIDSCVLRLESRIESAIRESEYKLTIKLGTLVTLAVGVTATIVKLIGH